MLRWLYRRVLAGNAAQAAHDTVVIDAWERRTGYRWDDPYYDVGGY